MSEEKIGIILVSHCQDLARGLAQMAAQMAPNVMIIPVGGTDEGSLGSSYEQVENAVETMRSSLGREALILALGDLGSSLMTIETVIETLGADHNVKLVRGPFVEGAIAGCVAIEQGATPDMIIATIETASRFFNPVEPVKVKAVEEKREECVPVKIVVGVENGLHARPAARIARMISDLDAEVTVNGVDGSSVLALMGLGVKMGDEVVISAKGSQCLQALETLTTALSYSDEDVA